MKRNPEPARETRRILMIAPFFTPQPRVGALRAFRLATHLPDAGYRPTVIHLASPGIEPTPLEKERLERVETLALKLPPWVHPAGAVNEPLPTPSDASPPPLSRLRAGLKNTNRTLDAHAPIDGWLPVLAAHGLRLRRLLRACHFDLLWSTADPWSSHLLGGWLSRQLQCPWVADFRDPWSLCSVRSKQRAAWAKHLDARAERWALRRADRVTFTARATQRQYSEAYPGLQHKFATFENGFDPSICAPRSAAGTTRGRSGIRFRALFLGRFRTLSSLQRWLPVLSSLRSAEAQHITLAAVGALTPSDAAQLAKTCPGIEYEALAPMPQEALGPRLQQADLLLLSTSPGRDQIIPAKLWDYLPAQAPILSICENREIEDLLLRTGRGRQLPLNEAGPFISERVQAWEAGREAEAQPEPNWEAIDHFSAPVQTARWAQLFETLVQDAQRQ